MIQTDLGPMENQFLLEVASENKVLIVVKG